MTAPVPAIEGRGIRKLFKRSSGETVTALDDVSLTVEHGGLTALVGPDGAGKTTLIRLMAGLLTADAGDLHVLGFDIAHDPQAVQDRVGYMPQKFGLYEDLSVQENLDLYADLHGVTAEERRRVYPQLMEMTALGPFSGRLAGRLSGGMKQKLGLACTLVRAPDLLLLDEPTVGVDPLSRRELWEIILHLVNDQGLTVLISTSYLDEAERCKHAIVMHEGVVLAKGPPRSITEVAVGRTFLATPPEGQPARLLQARLLDDPNVTDAVPQGGRVRLVKADGGALAGIDATAVEPRFEDGFMVLLHQAAQAGKAASLSLGRQATRHNGETVVEVSDLVRQFGKFTAVDHISFAVKTGEIFGLLGPNGAGKTTTFRMLCGLLPASSGTLEVAGVDLRTARASARQRVGYVAQKFSLYGLLSVTQNLEFFAGAYGLSGRRRRERIAWAMDQFELNPLARLPSGQLPGGYKQRLAMAAALIHEPEILFLDEPTSGADPLARREFWRRITALAEEGVTVIVTTPFHGRGRILRPRRHHGRRSGARPRHARRNPLPRAGDRRARADHGGRLHRRRRGGASQAWPPRREERGMSEATFASAAVHPAGRWRRVRALVVKESRQIMRDPSSIALGIVMPLILILLFGYALSLDVKNAPMALVIEQPSAMADEVAAGFRLSPYFDARTVTSMAEAEKLMRAHQVDGIVHMRDDFARKAAAGDAQVQVLLHGTDANTARIIESYALGAIGLAGQRLAAEGNPVVGNGPVLLQSRVWFNETGDSHYFLVPGLIVLIMTLVGAFLTALVMAREWERGTLEAIFVTPVRATEILLGKIVPYFSLGMIGFALCVVAAEVLFRVPLRGSLVVLTGVSMLYMLVSVGFGLFISSATKSQFVASQVALIASFLPAMLLSGFLFDIRSMPVALQIFTYILPARYFVTLLQTIFLAGDIWAVILPNAAVLALMAFLLLAATLRATRKKLA